MRRAHPLLLMLGLTLPCGVAAAGDLYVVVNATSPVQTLTRRDVVALFTGRTRAFPNGELAQAFDQPTNSPAREAFYLALTGMSLAQINSYWSRLHFSGQVQPPLTLTDDNAVVLRIRNDRSAIGYLTAKPQEPALRVVLVMHETAATSPQ